MTLAEWLATACLSVATLGLVYLALAIVMVARLATRRPGADPTRRTVTILKPLHGAEAHLEAHLATFLAQDYPAAVQIVFGVQSAQDPAVAVVRRLQASHPACAIDLVIDARLHGANRKVSNLINMETRIRHDVVVLADSDMIVAPDYLSRVVGELGRPGVGLVTLLYHGVPQSGLWSRLAASWIDTHFLPGVAVGLGLGLAKPCFGSTIALRRETLRAIGGFRRVADDLADDHALGAAVRALGLKVAIPNFTVGHACADRQVGDLVRHELRWQRTIRQIEPMGHVGSALAHPFAFACLAFIAEPSLAAIGFALAAFLMRAGLLLAVRRAFGVDRKAYRLLPLRDILSFGVFVASFFGRGVSWRGHRYDVAPSGALIPKTRS